MRAHSRSGGLRRLATIAPILCFGIALLAVGPARAEKFRKGINISYLFTFPKDSGWPPFRGRRSSVDDGELARLKQLGFDFIRLPVDPQPFLAAPEARRRELVDALRSFASRVGTAGLGLIVVGYTTGDAQASGMEVNASPKGDKAFQRYVDWLDEVASALDSAVGLTDVAVEVLNEPASPCNPKRERIWSERQAETARLLKASHPRIRIVLTGGCWSGVEALMRLRDIPDDPTTLFDVHYYEPFTFTHQGATWAAAVLPYIGGLQFPPSTTDKERAYAEIDRLIGDKTLAGARGLKLRQEARREVDAYVRQGKTEEKIRVDLGRLAHWADCRGIQRSRLLLGEFGAIEGPPDDPARSASRARWISAMRATAEEIGMGWAMWAYFKPLGLLGNEQDRDPTQSVVSALGLGQAVASASPRELTEANNAC